MEDDPVKIKHIEPIAVSLPLTKPVKMAGVELRTADNLIVRMESMDGIVGWGEAASAPIMTGETAESMVAAVRHLAPYIEGRAADDFAGASSMMNLWMYGNQAAKAAIEMAMHDLVGKATHQPVHALHVWHRAVALVAAHREPDPGAGRQGVPLGMGIDRRIGHPIGR